MLQIISERIQLAYTSMDQNQRQNAEIQLQELEEQDSQLSSYLLQIYEQQPQIKFFTIILLKQLIKRKWNMHFQDPMQKKRINFLNEEYKKNLRETILQLFIQENQPQMKSEIFQIINEISRTDYPNKYPQLLHYFENEIIQGKYADENFQFFLQKTFKIMSQNQHKNEQFNKLWEKLAQIWVSTKLDSCSPNYILLLDKVFLNFILSYSPQIWIEQIQQIFLMLLQRAAQLFNHNTKNYIKNLQYLSKKISILFQIYQVTLEEKTQDYINFLIFYISSDKKQLIKSGLIGLIKLFKNPILFLSDQLFEKLLISKNDQKKQELKNYRTSVLTQIKTIFDIQTKNLFEKLLNYLTSSNELSFEDMIEQEEENDFDKLIHPKNADVFCLALIAAEQLIELFPHICFTLLKEYLEQTIAANFQINPNILESLLIILGLVPRIQQKLNLQNNLKFDAIFSFLQNSNQLSHQRRFAILLKRLTPILDNNQMILSLQQAGELLQKSQDFIVRYSSLMCIKEIIVNYKGDFQWLQVLMLTSPFIVDLIQNFTRTTIITPLLDLLTKLIEKSQIQQPDQIAMAIEQSGLLQLMQKKFEQAEQNQLIIEQVCEMIKTIIVAYPFGSQIQHLFQMSLCLIQSNLFSKQGCILSLILFILQEYCDQTKNYSVEQLLQLLPQNLHQMINNDPSAVNQSQIIMIMEELYLFQVFTIQDIPKQLQLLESKYAIKSIPLKNAVLGLTTTIILLMLNNKINDIEQFSGIIMLILNDFLQEQQFQQMDSKFRIEVQIVSILNRFIILAKAQFFQFLINNQIDLQNYIQNWIQKCQLLESSKAIKLNIIAFLIATDFLQPEIFMNFYQIILKQYQRIQQKQLSEQKQANLTAATRLFQYRASIRKDQLRQNQMYKDEELREFYRITVQNYINKHNLQNIYSNMQLF